MGLPWIRLDTSLPDNPKMLALLEAKDGHRAAFVYICGLAYSGKHGTEGLLTTSCLARINGRKADANLLVAHHFWLPTMGGWDINGWGDFQLSNDETRARRTKAQKAANIRWHGDENGASNAR